MHVEARIDQAGNTRNLSVRDQNRLQIGLHVPANQLGSAGSIHMDGRRTVPLHTLGRIDDQHHELTGM